MHNREISPGIYQVVMTDLERRRSFQVSPRWVDVVRRYRKGQATMAELEAEIQRVLEGAGDE